jgi:hypothetical protein
MIDEFVATTGYERKHAITLLNHPPEIRQGKVQRPRAGIYGPAVTQALVRVWEAAGGICSKRLAPFLPEFTDALTRHGELELEPLVREKLLQISPSTMDRLLKAERRKFKLRGLSTTKPGTLLKEKIPIRTYADWDDAKPGFMETDLVAHSGSSSAGEFLYSLVLTDVSTGWTECIGLLNKSRFEVVGGIERVRKRMPFALLGLDSDSGAEFINEHLLEYCRKHKITFTRSRPFKKNDQCRVEQKNFSVVRKVIGYSRFEGETACKLLSAVYSHLRLYVNFFQPSMMLQSKERNKSKITKIHDKAMTPYRRLLAENVLSDEMKADLSDMYLSLNPVELLRQIDQTKQRLERMYIPMP